MTRVGDLTNLADAAVRVLLDADPRRQELHGGSLTVVGTGIQSITQMTLEALAEIRMADVVLHVIGDPSQEALVESLNPHARTLTDLYGEETDRSLTYEAMIEQMLDHVVAGRRTVAAFYGHPGVFVYPTHQAVRRARALGYPARMLPGISAEDCLVADLGIDPGEGCHAFEATDLLYRHFPIDPSVHLLVWQPGALGDSTGGTGYDVSLVAQLARKLGQAYGPHHRLTVYEAPADPAGSPVLRSVPLVDLARTPLSTASTLHVPPRAPSGA